MSWEAEHPMAGEPGSCPFCERLQGGDVTETNEHAAAFADGFPVSRGHTLIVPRRHAAGFRMLTRDEQAALLDLVRVVQTRLDTELAPNGYNIGINDGPAAGQTVGHVHAHVIPRYVGDVPDPRGGIRWLFPEKADYWNTPD